MLFETERIKLRKMTQEDIPLYHKWRTDIDVQQTTNPYLDMYRYEETEAFVKNVILDGESASKNYLIVDKKTNEAIGITCLVNIDSKNRCAEMIIDIGEKSFWGKGYGSEAVTLLLDYAFLEMNLHRVELRVFATNERATRLYEGIGFAVEGRGREVLFRNGMYHDLIYMGILQDEWIAKRK